MPLKKSFNLGDTVTAKTVNIDGDTIYISGKISSVNGDNIFITRKWPEIEHFSVKKQEIVTKGE